MSKSSKESNLEAYFEAFEDDSMREIARATLRMNDESERGMVLVQTSLLEVRLEALLREALEDCEATERLFSEPNAPLGSLNAKINLAKSLGLVSKDEFIAMHMIRKIRNDFAHQALCSFEDGSVRDRTFSLTHGMSKLEQNRFEAKQWFSMCSSALVMNLHSRKNLMSAPSGKE